MKTQFDLEQQIMQCWNVTEDIDLLYENVLDGNHKPTHDEIANCLLGMKQMCEMRFHKLFRTFEKYIKEVHESKVCDNSEVLRQTQSPPVSGY